MAVGPSKLDISKVHIILQRHAEAVSNVAVHPGADGDLDGLKLTTPQLRMLAKHLVMPALGCTPPPNFKLGDCLPDGLTQYGLDTAAAWVDAVTDHGRRTIENVYMLVSSPLTRAVQTLGVVQQAFSGPFAENCDKAEPLSSRRPTIYCHPGIKEATFWVQDIPPLTVEKDGTRTTSYIKIAGGDAAPGRVIGEEKVDLSRVVWPDGVPNEWDTPEGRKLGLTTAPDLDRTEEGARQARLWLRKCAMKALKVHQSEGRTGNPRIVVCLHGGILNFITQSGTAASARMLHLVPGAGRDRRCCATWRRTCTPSSPWTTTRLG